MKKKIIALVLSAVMLVSCLSFLAGCGGGKKPDALVIMTEELDGVFNPFYSTTGADAGVVSMTQIGMLTYGYENGEVTVACGDGEAVAVKDYDIQHNVADNTTTYTFVIKNGIKFSDGKPLTMHDVLFNLYVYLDPVYTGSSTMYSTDIVGLQEYRYQQAISGESNDDLLDSSANDLVRNRINELITLFQSELKVSPTKEVSEAKMREVISTWFISEGYQEAITNEPDGVDFNKQLLADYELALKYFREELDTDFVTAKEAYTEEPYKSHSEFADEIFCFMYYEGMVEVEFAKKADGKPDRSKIEKLTPRYPAAIDTKEEAIQYVYDATVNTKFDQIITIWATAQKLQNDYRQKALELVLHKTVGDGVLAFPNISGIVSLGHTTDVQNVTCKNGSYTVAHDHNEDGTPKNADQYDVLQITINGVDPKAIWNFAFSVAPQHYYAPGYEVDIANNKFGVEWGSFDFHRDVLQSTRNLKVPMGAGAYMATDADNKDNPDGNSFFKNNVVYYKANPYFMLGKANIEKVRYQVVSASNALNALETGSVHYVTPQFTQYNIDKINGLAKDGVKSMHTQQLGYGYIGINASKVPDINLRKAIMSAMNISLALSYYSPGMAQNIYFPMSTVSWAYPKDENGNLSNYNNKPYPDIQFTDDAAKAKIREYMAAANNGQGVSEGDSALKITFTIAGSNLTDHPTYAVFQKAQDILNACGWDVEVIADSQALTKLSTGSLAVWAAAWGSTIDPDLYQVYHKNSTATSTLAWGYPTIKNDQSSDEYAILSKLSEVIDSARETEDQDERAALYEEALGYILDLAIELPVYQREVLYAYNSEVIDSSTLPTEINPYTSPLDRIWELKFAE